MLVVQHVVMWCTYSDVLCGSLHCDVSDIVDPVFVSFDTPWTQSSGCTSDTDELLCVSAEYATFYNGPARSDPGLVPDGAVCGTGKVTLLGNSVSMLCTTVYTLRCSDAVGWVASLLQ